YKITNDGLIYLGNFEKIEIGNYISTINIRKFKKTNDSIDSDFQKASYYLGVLFAKEDYINVFLRFGVVL
ncbi:MAG: hypothetical protein ACFFKA_20660, partial [Candidatus Thorarchaeota archaeon]